jgi:hypothetical protein
MDKRPWRVLLALLSKRHRLCDVPDKKIKFNQRNVLAFEWGLPHRGTMRRIFGEAVGHRFADAT